MKLMQIFLFLFYPVIRRSNGLLFQIISVTENSICYAHRICTFKNTLICTRTNFEFEPCVLHLLLHSDRYISFLTDQKKGSAGKKMLSEFKTVREEDKKKRIPRIASKYPTNKYSTWSDYVVA